MNLLRVVFLVRQGPLGLVRGRKSGRFPMEPLLVTSNESVVPVSHCQCVVGVSIPKCSAFLRCFLLFFANFCYCLLLIANPPAKNARINFIGGLHRETPKNMYHKEMRDQAKILLKDRVNFLVQFASKPSLHWVIPSNYVPQKLGNALELRRKFFGVFDFFALCWDAVDLGNCPKSESSRKWFGEGAKGLLDPASKRPLVLVRNGVAPIKRLLGDLCSLGPTESKKTFCALPQPLLETFPFSGRN